MEDNIKQGKTRENNGGQHEDREENNGRQY